MYFVKAFGVICPVSQNKTSIKQNNDKKPQLIQTSQQALASKSNYTGAHRRACLWAWVVRWWVLRVWLSTCLRLAYSCVCLCSGGQELSQPQKLALGSGDVDRLHWPRPASVRIALSGTLKRIISSLQTLTSRGGGGGAVPLLAWPPAIRTLGKNSSLLLIQ